MANVGDSLRRLCSIQHRIYNLLGRVTVSAVPAAIIEHLSSDDVTVQEGDTVVLVCNVTGVPTPDVTWHRRPASGPPTDKQRTSRNCTVLLASLADTHSDLSTICWWG